jgi:hypothetical protein
MLDAENLEPVVSSEGLNPTEGMSNDERNRFGEELMKHLSSVTFATGWKLIQERA